MPSQPRTAMSPDERVLAEISDEIQRVSTQIALEMGPAVGARMVPESQEVELWGQRDPLVDYETLVSVLQTTGVTDPAMLDPESQQSLAIAKTAPEIAQLLAQPSDPSMAVALASLAEFPHRAAILAPYENDPEGAVKKSKQLDAAWQRETGKPQAAEMPEMMGGEGRRNGTHEGY